MDYLASRKVHPEASILVDVRNAPTHVRKEKIEGALDLPLDELEQRLSQLPADKTIVVYCWDTWCNMAKKASVILLEHGFQAKEMTGGIAAWKTLGLPTEALAQ